MAKIILKHDEITQRIVDVMQQKNLTKYQLAKEIEVDRSSITRIFSGERGWSLEIINSISEVYGIDLAYLVQGKENNLQGYIHTINTLKETIRVILDDKKFSDTNTAEPAHTSKGVVSL